MKRFFSDLRKTLTMLMSLTSVLIVLTAACIFFPMLAAAFVTMMYFDEIDRRIRTVNVVLDPILGFLIWLVLIYIQVELIKAILT